MHCEHEKTDNIAEAPKMVKKQNVKLPERLVITYLAKKNMTNVEEEKKKQKSGL